MNKIERIIEAMITGNTSDTTPLYFEKGFSFMPMVFSTDYNQNPDWSVSVSPDCFLGLMLVVEVEVWQLGHIYRIKPTKAEKKALIKAYDVWYKNEKARHKAIRQEASR